MTTFDTGKEAKLQLLKDAVEQLRSEDITDNQLEQLLKLLELTQGTTQEKTVNFEVD